MKSGSFWVNDWVQAISQFTDRHTIAIAFIIMAILPLLFPKTWSAMNSTSDRFEKKHKRLLLGIAILMILAIPLVYYLCSR
jgi:hypothetical protein